MWSATSSSGLCGLDRYQKLLWLLLRGDGRFSAKANRIPLSINYAVEYYLLSVMPDCRGVRESRIYSKRAKKSPFTGFVPQSGITVCCCPEPSRTGPTVLSCFVQKINPKPTDFQPSYRNTHSWNGGWFKGNQLCSNPHIGKPTVDFVFQPLYEKCSNSKVTFQFSPATYIQVLNFCCCCVGTLVTIICSQFCLCSTCCFSGRGVRG